MVGTPDEMLPDRGPVSARQALRAADELRVFDGRATVWLLVQRLLEMTGFTLFLVAVFYGGLMGERWILLTMGTAGMVAAFVGYEGAVARLAGAEPRRWRSRWRVALGSAVVLVILLDAMGALGSWPSAQRDRPLAVGLAVVAAGHLLAPVVRWAWSRRRPRGTTAWPDGAQAYAVLSVLARAQWVHPHRLSLLTGLPLDRCDEWVRACAVRGLAVPAGRGRVFSRNAEITPRGLARLDRWTAELTRRAAGAQPCTDSTAPTSADVTSDRSSSEVT